MSTIEEWVWPLSEPLFTSTKAGWSGSVSKVIDFISNLICRIEGTREIRNKGKMKETKEKTENEMTLYIVLTNSNAKWLFDKID